MHVFSKHGIPEYVILTEVLSLFPNFSTPLEKHLTWSSTSPLDTIPKVMDRMNRPIKPWNSTCRYFAIISRITGTPCDPAPACRICLQQYPEFHYRDLPVICQQRLPPEPYCPSWMWPCVIKCKRLSCWSGQTPPRTKSHHCQISALISGSHGCQAISSPGLHCQTTSFHQSQVLPDHLTFSQALWKVLRTFRNPC